VLSNAGPRRTMALTGDESLFDGAWRQRLDAAPHEAPIIHFSFVCDRPLIDGFDGSLVFGNTRNLIYLEIPSIISPRLAPAGQFLHTAYGAPADAARPDLKTEAANALKELEDNFPGALEGARFLVRARHAGASPGMHRWPGFMMPVETPVQNLFNVGDGATPPGTIGTEGAAASAKAAVEMILAQSRARPHRWRTPGAAGRGRRRHRSARRAPAPQQWHAAAPAPRPAPPSGRAG
jgi:phytoene desaturase